uniref:ORF15 n=1 Tax=Malaco herpesvirus 2 TaxID=3031798 RepID=A0AA48SEZ3_9VIRU|nr:TPA_asm: ORF15 [Malaco herpesvirus 2]
MSKCVNHLDTILSASMENIKLMKKEQNNDKKLTYSIAMLRLERVNDRLYTDMEKSVLGFVSRIKETFLNHPAIVIWYTETTTIDLTFHESNVSSMHTLVGKIRKDRQNYIIRPYVNESPSKKIRLGKRTFGLVHESQQFINSEYLKQLEEHAKALSAHFVFIETFNHVTLSVLPQNVRIVNIGSNICPCNIANCCTNDPTYQTFKDIYSKLDDYLT